MQTEIIVDVMFSDAAPSGLGRNPGPPTSAHEVVCRGVKQHDNHPDWYLLALEVTNSPLQQAIGTKWNLRLQVPHSGLTEGAINARTAIMKKCLISFQYRTREQLNVVGAAKIKLSDLVGRKGHVWWERGNPAAPEKHEQSYAEYRFLDAEEYGKVSSGEVEVQLKNTPLKGIPNTNTGPGAATFGGPAPIGGDAPVGPGGPFAASPPNGAAAPVQVTPPAQPAATPDASANML